METTTQLKEKICTEKEIPPIKEIEHIPSLYNLIKDCLTYEPSTRPSWDDIMKTLQESAITCCVQDTLAAHFWTSSICEGGKLLREEISYSSFIFQFYNYFNLGDCESFHSSDELHSSKDLLNFTDGFYMTEEQLKSPIPRRRNKKESNENISFSENPSFLFLKNFFSDFSGKVSLENFGRVVQLFAPFSVHKNHSVGQQQKPESVVTFNSKHFLTLLKEVSKEKWFCGNLATDTIRQIVSSMSPSSFFLCYSTEIDLPDCFSLFFLSSESVLEQRVIQNVNGTFTLFLQPHKKGNKLNYYSSSQAVSHKSLKSLVELAKEKFSLRTPINHCNVFDFL